MPTSTDSKGLAQKVAILEARLSTVEKDFESFKAEVSDTVQRLRDESSETNAQLFGVSEQQTEDEQALASVQPAQEQH